MASWGLCVHCGDQRRPRQGPRSRHPDTLGRSLRKHGGYADRRFRHRRSGWRTARVFFSSSLPRSQSKGAVGLLLPCTCTINRARLSGVCCHAGKRRSRTAEIRILAGYSAARFLVCNAILGFPGLGRSMVSGVFRLEPAVTQPIERDAIYRRRRFPRDVIETCVRWYLTYRLSYRDLVALMAERDVHLTHTTIMRWVFRFVPEYEKRWNRRAKPVGSSWRVDETFIHTRPKIGYLYRGLSQRRCSRHDALLRKMERHR